MELEGVIIAGGLATRMLELGSSLPKALLPVGGRPIIAWQIDLLASIGVSRVTVMAGGHAPAISEEALRLGRAGVQIRVVTEPSPAGSGGCLRDVRPESETLIVLFGDVMVHMDLAALVSFHSARRSILTAAVHPNDHPSDSDLVELGADDRISALHRKPHPQGLLVANLTVAGAFALQREVLAAVPAGGASDLVHDIMTGLLAASRPVFGYRTTEYLKDIGTPPRYAAVQADWESGRVAAMRLPTLRPAAFLDRDGTINRHIGYASHPDQLELLPGAGRAICALNRAGVLAVVVTNQPVVARGLCDELGLRLVHARLEAHLGAEGAFVDAIYYCPHHPEAGFPGEAISYKVACSCRKPGTGMVERAAAELPIDLSRSALFGDSWRDVETARKAGFPAYLIGHDEADGGPAVRTVADLEAGVREWLGRLSSSNGPHWPPPVPFSPRRSRCAEHI
jgi:histidinol-phosphate phosphatase family protein